MMNTNSELKILVDTNDKKMNSLCINAKELIDDMSICKNKESKIAVKNVLEHSIDDIQKSYQASIDSLKNLCFRQAQELADKATSARLAKYDAIVFHVTYGESGRSIKHITADYLCQHDANDELDEDKHLIVFPIRGYNQQKQVIFDYVRGNEAFFEMLGHWCHPMNLARSDADSEDITSQSPVVTSPFIYGDRLDNQLTDSEISMYLYGKAPNELSSPVALSTDVNLSNADLNCDSSEIDNVHKSRKNVKELKNNKKKKGAKKQ